MARALAMPHGRSARWRVDPFRAAFRLLTSVRFAMLNILAVAALAWVGVVLPQIPGYIRGSASMRAGWIAERRDELWPLTGPLDRAGAFDVFHSALFYGVFAVLLASVAVCSVSRIRPIWRSIRRPQVQVSERFFESAQSRDVLPPMGRESLAKALQERHYAVSSSTEGGVLYADRFAWGRMGTSASHLSLLILLVGGVMSWSMSYSSDMLIAQGGSAPVLDPANPDHMQLRVLGFEHTKDASGRDNQIASSLVVYKHGQEVARGLATINAPLHYDGFSFHQAAYSETGAALRITDPTSGAVLYSETLNLYGTLPVPRVIATDATGRTVFDDAVPPSFFPGSQAAASQITVLGHGQYALALNRASPTDPWELIVAAPDGTVKAALAEVPAAVGGLRFGLEGVQNANYLLVPDLPGTNGEDTLVEQYTAPDGASRVALVRPQEQAVVASEAASAKFGAYSVAYLGPRAFSGITVKRDPGTLFIWGGAQRSCLGGCWSRSTYRAGGCGSGCCPTGYWWRRPVSRAGPSRRP